MKLLALALLAIDFEKQVVPVLEQTCLACHGPSNAQGGLRVDTAAIQQSIAPGQPDQSPLYTRTRIRPGRAGAMPPGLPLTPEQGEVLRAWIAEGAPWPKGYVIGGARKAARPPDDAALVGRLRARIAATPAPAFTPYKQTIPGTDVSFEMVPIPGGEFLMGSPADEAGRKSDEGPQRPVKLGAFWMGKHEVTWDEYRLFMFPKDPRDELVDAVSRPTRPYVEMSFGMGINGYPAISMTQHAANKYAQWLSARTGHFYRLPTEAEWEYACRAGSAAAAPSPLGDYAWFADNSNDKYQPVGRKKPNAWGLHDMLGNVMEWTLDAYGPYAAAPGLIAAPWVAATKPYPHAVRGGSWADAAGRCRCAARVGSDASWKMQDPQLPKSIWYHTDAQWLGFRLVRPLEVPPAAQMHRMWNNGVEKE